jgi:hypothetical protein
VNLYKNTKIAALFLLLLFLSPAFARAATVKLRVVVVNPSDSKPQKKSIKNYLPKEVTLKDILDQGELEVDYDEEQGMFFAYKNDVELAPGETKTFELVMDDIWLIPEDKLGQLKDRTETLMGHFKKTSFFEQADAVAKTIYGRLDDIRRAQNDQTVNRQQHIAYYRDDLRTLDSVKLDIERLEKLLVKAGGPPNIDIVEKSDVNLKSPNSKTTWIIIFIILIFIAILGGAFYFTWQGQVKVTENIFTKEKEASFSEFKNSGKPDETEKKS